MSRTAVKIETGLLGAALIMALVLFGSGQAGNPVQENSVRYYGGRASSRIAQRLQMMHSEISNTSLLHLAEPDRMLFKNKAGDLLEYCYAYQTIWRNGNPVLMDIDAFHFEYRNAAGHALQNSDSNLNDVQTVMFVMRYDKEAQKILANGRIRIQPRSFSMGESEEETYLVKAN